MTMSDGSQDKIESKRSVPVMCCHPEDGGVAQLVRGSAPSTPLTVTGEKRRMSVKKFFRVTPEEDQFIRKRAQDVGLEQASYLRAQALGTTKLRKARRIRSDWAEIRKCLGVINKAGNVVNQFIVMLRRDGGDPAQANGALKELVAAAKAIGDAFKVL